MRADLITLAAQLYPIRRTVSLVTTKGRPHPKDRMRFCVRFSLNWLQDINRSEEASVWGE